MSEFEATHGIADLVFLELIKGWSKSLNLGSFSPSWTYIFKVLSKKSFNTSDVIELSGCSEQYAKKILRNLERDGLLLRLKNGSWKLVKKPAPLTKKIISIECKLKNWKKALSQAIRYQDYSNQTWVIVDAEWCSSIKKNLDLFMKYNVGLATVRPDNECNVLYSPFPTKPKHKSSFWFANSIAARELKNGYFINSL